MAIRIIDDAKLQNIAVTIQGKDNGGQMTVDEMPDRIQAIPSGGGTLISKTITENGVYNASSDNADGYDVVTVDVPQDPDESLIKFFTNTIEYIKIDEECNIPKSFTSGDNQRAYSKLVFFSAKLAKEYLESPTFRKSTSLVYANVGMVTLIMPDALSVTYKLTSLVIPNSAICSLLSTNAFFASSISAGTGYVWVYDSLVSGYQSATNWSAYASQIKGFSEAPIYDNATTYEIGDVCQYNGRFYGYCKRDLTSSTGNPPTGTTADNDYWEYVADIEGI